MSKILPLPFKPFKNQPAHYPVTKKHTFSLTCWDDTDRPSGNYHKNLEPTWHYLHSQYFSLTYSALPTSKLAVINKVYSLLVFNNSRNKPKGLAALSHRRAYYKIKVALIRGVLNQGALNRSLTVLYIMLISIQSRPMVSGKLIALTMSRIQQDNPSNITVNCV